MPREQNAQIPMAVVGIVMKFFQIVISIVVGMLELSLDSMKYELGYRILTLLWTDGYSNVPVDFAPLSSRNEKLIVSKAKEYDGRTLAGKIRKQACMKAPELILQMLSQAVAAGHTAKYVLFDSWFATPKGIMDIKNRLHMDVIAMVKKSGKVYYEYDGEQHDVKEIFSRSKKRRGRSKYLLSVEVSLFQKKYGKILECIPAKLVYVRNKANGFCTFSYIFV